MKIQQTPIGEAAGRVTKWGQGRRLEFIDFRLYWEGRINRSDLIDFFGISMPQASLDLARYMEMAPDNVRYDRREKVYLASPAFRPALVAPDSHTYLNELHGVTTGTLRKETAFIGRYPAADVVPHPSRQVAPDILGAVLRAIHQHAALEVHYQSLSHPDPACRTISPHAIAFDGFRWHVRAYCHEREDFRDFVMARISQVGEQRPSDIDPTGDAAWTNFVEVKIGPHPGLSAGQRRAIEMDYGMENGVAVLRTRLALLFYVLRQLGLSDRKLTDATAQQIVLINRMELGLDEA